MSRFGKQIKDPAGHVRTYGIFIRGTNWLGDSVLSLPAVKGLRRLYPAARMVMLCPRWLAPVWAAGGLVDRVAVFDSPWGALRVSAGLRSERFDLGVVLPNSMNSALCSVAAGASRRIGYARQGRAFLLSDPVRVEPADLAVHQVHYYLKLVRALGNGAPDVDAVPRLEPPEPEQRAFRDRLGGRSAFGINPGSGQGTARLWPAERFAEIAERLKAARPDHEIVFFGAENDRPRIDAVRQSLGFETLDMAGRTTLPQLFGALSCLSLYVTNDNGAMHAACALGVPVVAIFGGSNPATTGPCSPGARVVRKDVECAPCLKKDCPTDHRCMRGVTADDVWEAVAAAGSAP